MGSFPETYTTYTDAALIRLPCLQGVLPADVVEDGELSRNYQEPY